MRPDPSPPENGVSETLNRRAHRRFWRSIAEAEGAPDVDRPHPIATVAAPDRRDFMKLMGASIALAGLSGCSHRPLDKIVPYRAGPAEQTYGKPVFYASVLPRDGHGVGVLVETNMGRPTKVEGNPSHPASLGATSVFEQAAVLELWDPDRSQTVRHGRTIATWNDFLAALQAQFDARAGSKSTRLRILTETVTSPSLHAQIDAVLQRFPRAKWHQWQPLNDDNARDGAETAYGRRLDVVYRFDRARTIVSIDGDFLDDGPGSVRYALDFAARRHAHAAPDGRSRLYAFESTPTLTGAAADHRLALRASDMGHAMAQLAISLGAMSGPSSGNVVAPAWIDAIAADLRASRGASIVAVGRRQPPHVHALAHLVNANLGNVGNAVLLVPPAADDPSNQLASLRDLVGAMNEGVVEAIVVAGANPVYTAPADLGFASALAKVPFKVHHGLYADETAARCDWHVPAAHPLECFGDLRAFDGTVALQQPGIAPLYDGKSAHELLAALGGDVVRSDRELVDAYWQRDHAADFAAFRADALRKGVVEGSAPGPVDVAVRGDLADALAKATASHPGGSQDDLEIVFVPDSRLGDGRHANNAWLQELPKPLSQLAWDNVALVAPALARRYGIANEDVVRLGVGPREIEVAAWVMPGMPVRSVTLALGYGRTRAGHVGSGRGVDAYAIRASDAPWFANGVTIARTGRKQPLACAQTHHAMEGRDIVRTFTVDEAAACTPNECGTPHYRDERTLYEAPPMGPYAWAMSIDLSACIGCGACTIACQAENNIPVVGRDEMRNGREMHWIRIDRYYEGDVADPRALFQPVPCMQCEHAPCEVVCPVEASVHDAQGINVQVYNRCVGTRFCSNNCPYKVRRFNFLQYVDDVPGLDAQRNPEVTVRMRGVMEKCNYCLQRITNAKIAADVDNRRLRDGEVVTACQAVCPTRAIVFGDLADPASEVNRRKNSPLDYALLAELNTRPRTTYLARVTNPSPALARSAQTTSRREAPPPGAVDTRPRADR
ncbi:MAG TPA: 4Fe-4S dicluster domain-containing protein [Casimicrobiaceae bacterium]|nr:4Fe-4S dicluster domain-containing protein [Casimicrobiaceae bacterium]